MTAMENEEVDLETLQAQIDMSMAFTNNLVSGWMKASKATLPSTSSHINDEQVLEEYMRRPPRLGVGASAPESTGVLSRESVKLKNKLVSNGKKRAREEEPSAAAGTKAIVISDDEEESRARVITKKPRVDPFAPKEKKNQTKADHTMTAAAAAAKPTGASPANMNKAESVKHVPMVVDDEPSEPPRTGNPQAHETPASTSTKKKKKKKHKTHARKPADGGSPDANPTSISVLRASAAPVSPNQQKVIVITDTPPPDVPTPASLLSSAITVAKSLFSKALLSDTSSGPPIQNVGPVQPLSGQAAAVPQASSTRLDPFGMPLLNLSGPPAVAGDEQAGSPKKKKRKKKKKKKALSEPAGNAEVIDVDADGHDEDD